jgi:uncharacterized protein YdeI (YjbR/CyaY-like superfamily)
LPVIGQLSYKHQSAMTINKTLYVTTRKEWRDWLSENFNKTTEIWLIYPKKNTGKIRILYNDAVEEALCFGWIDSTVKALDNNNTIQRFTPRNPKSDFSQANKERLKWLYDKKMIHPSFEKMILQTINYKFLPPSDIIETIKKDSIAWQNYQMFSDSYKRIRIAYIDSARSRPDEFKKRLSSFIDKTRKNKLIKGFGGIEKYY